MESAKAAGNVAFEKLSKLAELEKCAAEGLGGGPLSSARHTDKPDPVSSTSPHDHDTTTSNTTESLDSSSRPHMSPSSPTSSRCTDRLSSQFCSEDEDEEIDVDD